MNIIIFLVVGALGGWIAEKILKRDDSLIWNIIFGCGGAVLAGMFLGPFLTLFPSELMNQILTSVVGALGLSFIAGMIFGKK